MGGGTAPPSVPDAATAAAKKGGVAAKRPGDDVDPPSANSPFPALGERTDSDSVPSPLCEGELRPQPRDIKSGEECCEREGPVTAS
jgi:hypothetical protein